MEAELASDILDRSLPAAKRAARAELVRSYMAGEITWATLQACWVPLPEEAYNPHRKADHLAWARGAVAMVDSYRVEYADNPGVLEVLDLMRAELSRFGADAEGIADG